ncbi:MAG: epimerase, partial [Bergeyella zoohelcum]|nr:epimerase [Bergeyella zoohelcum]
MIANKIGIIGCGWLGTHLALHLKKNFNLLVTTTNEQKKTNLEQLGLETFVINFFDDKISDSSSLLHPSILHDTDCIIITIPFSKRANINQLKCRFQNLCNSIKGFQKQIFVMSSIGIYPDKDDAIITENSLEDKELNPNILLVENLMQSYFPQVNILRLGGLMGGNR